MKWVHVAAAQNHMATTFEFVVSVTAVRQRAAQSALQEAHAAIARLEDELTEYRMASPVYQLNRAPLGKNIWAPSSLLELLDLSAQIETATNGAFSATAKSGGDYLSLRERIGWDSNKGCVRKIWPETRLGFGAIGKGYALDQVHSHLQRLGFSDFLLTAGGSSILVSGFFGPATPWKLGWSWSKDDRGELVGQAFEHQSGQAMAIGISGVQEKGPHLIDPRRGLAAVDTVISSWVGHKRASVADALSTALFVAGFESALQWRHEAAPALLQAPAIAVIEADSTPLWNGVFQNSWGSCVTRDTLKLFKKTNNPPINH